MTTMVATEKSLAERVAFLEKENTVLRESVSTLETQMSELQELLSKVGAGIEQAKQNPMIANMMRAFGLE